VEPNGHCGLSSGLGELQGLRRGSREYDRALKRDLKQLRADIDETEVVRVEVSSSKGKLLTNRYSDRNPVWSPDGQWIAFVRTSAKRSKFLAPDEVWMVSSHAPPRQRLLLRDGQLFHSVDRWSRDGGTLYSTRSDRGGNPSNVAIDLGTKSVRRTAVQPNAVSPDGRLVVFVKNTKIFFKGPATHGREHPSRYSERDSELRWSCEPTLGSAYIRLVSRFGRTGPS
jgi:dipeptidyl aminopeptidase/acylaminoacyl peptidase